MEYTLVTKHTESVAAEKSIQYVIDYLYDTLDIGTTSGSGKESATAEYTTVENIREIDDLSNTVIVLAGADSVSDVVSFNEHPHTGKCIIWIATTAMSNENYNLAIEHADIAIIPRVLLKNDTFGPKAGTKANIVTVDKPLNPLTLSKIRDISKSDPYQDIQTVARNLMPPKKNCWEFFFKSPPAIPVVVLLGGSRVESSECFSTTAATLLAQWIAREWSNQRAYLLIVSDKHTPVESRNAFLEVIQNRRISHNQYAHSQLQVVLTFAAYNQGAIVATQECIWKMSMISNIPKLHEVTEGMIDDIYSPTNPIHDVQEIIFEPSLASNDRMSSESLKLEPTVTVEIKSIKPHIFGDPHSVETVSEFTSSLLKSGTIEMTNSRKSNRKTDPNYTLYDHCDELITVPRLVKESFPQDKNQKQTAIKL